MRPDRGAAAEDLDLSEVLLAALRGLSPLDRAVVVHRYLLDDDVASVAAELDLTPRAVRSRASRALATVRAALATKGPGQAETTTGWMS